jgi:hypothetical protein
MSLGVELTVAGVAALPFLAYGIAGLWEHRKNRPGDPIELLARRYAQGEIDDVEYERRLSMLTYGPALMPPPIRPFPELEPGDREPSA